MRCITITESTAREVVARGRPLTSVRAMAAVVGLATTAVATIAFELPAPMSNSPQADALEHLWWLFFGVACVVHVLVLGTLGVAMLRRRDPELEPVARASTQVATAIVIAAGVTLVGLLVLLTASTLAGSRLGDLRALDASPGRLLTVGANAGGHAPSSAPWPRVC